MLINNWEVISDKFRKYGRYYVRVRCTCGSNIEKDLPTVHLTTLASKGCEKCSRFFTSKGYELISGSYWSGVVNKAKVRKLPFEITIQDAWNKYIKQEGKCALTGLDIVFEPNSTHSNSQDGRVLRTASLDRIKSDEGYTLDNIQWVHKDVNRMKNKFDQEHFITICKLITEKHECKI